MVVPVLEKHDFGDKWAFRGNYPDGQCYGMTEQQILDLYKEADAFLNVTGAQEIRDEHLRCRRRIYVESDPFASQVKVAQGDQGMIAMLAAHDTHFSFGENLGAADCPCRLKNFAGCPRASRWSLICGINPMLAPAPPTTPSLPGTIKADKSPGTARPITGRRIASLKNS